MNYRRIYEELIERARNRDTFGYVERHHIIPRCIGGADTEENIVVLYPEEHFLAHILLVKIHTESTKLISAVAMMCAEGNNERWKGRRGRKLYGWLKRRQSEHLSVSNTGPKNPMYGRRWYHDGEKNILLNPGQPVPIGLVPGKVNVHSDSSKRKFSQQRKGKTLSPETRNKLSLLNKGKKHSPEAIEKIRIAARKPRNRTCR